MAQTVFLNLQIKQIADGLTAMGWNPSALPANALVAYSATAPVSPTNGQLWLNSATSVLQIYGAGAWQTVALTTAQSNILADLVTNGYYNKLQTDNLLNQKQPTLLAGTNIKTINGQSPVGSGDLTVIAAMGTLDSLSDVTCPLPTTGQTITYNGTGWVNSTPATVITAHSGLTGLTTGDDHTQYLNNTRGDARYSLLAHNHAISTLTDATITTPANGQVLTYNTTSSKWVNTTPVAGITDHTLLTNIGTNTHAQIDTALTRLATTSGTNTGDQTTITGNAGTVTDGVYLSTVQTITGAKTFSSLITGSISGNAGTVTNGLYTTNIGVTVQAYDATILKSANIGVTVQGYDATTLKSSAIGVTVQGYDATTLKSANIGTTVQGYDVNTAKLNVAQTFTSAQRGSLNTITYGATITPDFSLANNFVCTLTGNVVVANPTNLVAGQYGKITLIQDATGGRTIGYGTYFKFAGGTAPTAVTTANAKTTYYYEVNSATEIIISSIADWK